MSSILNLRSTTPKARKNHKCMFCGDEIKVGERYERTTCVFEGILYDWVTHCECSEVASLLDMYDGYDGEGIDNNVFITCIDEYIYENHYDKELDDIDKNWQLPYHELVKKILIDFELNK